MKHEDIRFRTRRIKAIETTEQDNGEIQKIYQGTFDLSYIYLTKRSLKNYQKNINGTMKSIL